MVNNVIEELPIPSISDVMAKKRALVFDKLLKGAQESVKEEFVEAAKELAENEDAILLLAKSLELSFEKAFCESDYEKIGKSRSRNKNRSEDFGDRRGSRHSGSRGRESRGDRRFGDKRSGGGKHKSRERGRDRHFSGDRLFIPKGKKDNMNPRDLVSMIEKESKIPGNRIHEVQMMHAYSFFTVSEKDARAIKKTFNNPNQREFITDA